MPETTTAEVFDDSATRIASAIIASHGKDRAALERVRDAFISSLEKSGAHIVLNQVVVKLEAHLDTLPETEPARPPRDLAEVISP